jgi:predicted transcriptional regulator
MLPQITEMHQQGSTVREIANTVSKSEAWVYQSFEKAGYVLSKFNSARGKKRLWTKDEIAYLTANRDMTVAELANKLDRSQSSVKTKVNKLHLHRDWSCVVCNTQISQRGKYCTAHNWVERRVSQVLYRSAKKGWESDLTEADIISIVQKDCTYCGDTGGGIDRVDSGIGYMKSNTVPCCYRCNTMKLNSNKDEWIIKMKQIIKNTEVTDE